MTASGAKVLVTTPGGRDKVGEIRQRLAGLETVVVVGPDVAGVEGGVASFNGLENGHADVPVAIETRGEDPAMMIFTSGTTGPPKGALHAHRVLIGHIPGVQTHHEFMPQAGDKLVDPGGLGLGWRLAQCAVAGIAALACPLFSSPAQKF